MKHFVAAAAFALALASAGVANAHEGAHAQSTHAGSYALELSSDSTGFTVTVEDEATHRPSTAAALSVRATVLSGGRTQAVDLKKSSVGVFRGAIPLTGPWRVIVAISNGAGAPVQGRFAASTEAAHDADGHARASDGHK